MNLVIKRENGVVVFLLMYKGERMECLVDEADYGIVRRYQWSAASNKSPNRGIMYAYRSVRIGENKWTRLALHNLLFPNRGTIFVDHRNRNGLDYRRFNLRLATRSQNNQNRKGWSRLGFKGIRRNQSGTYTARVKLNGKHLPVGTFPNPTDAARAYNQAALKYFGEFANLNELDPRADITKDPRL